MPPFRLFSLPNLITCANLLTGCVGIWLAMRGDSVTACYLVGLAAAFDFADGLVARTLNLYSPVGKDLDSLADMVSFGLLPAVLMAQLLANTPAAADAPWLPLLGFLLAVFSALRLAKFNVDTRQTTSFMGVPTPAATLFVAALPLVLAAPASSIGNSLLAPLLRTAPVLLGLTVMLCLLMISEIPLFALKFSNLRLEPLNILRYSFVAASGALVVLLGWAGVPLAILLYIGLSLLKIE
jgi:CDP-diacylglycerol--serine O-phosphatidyltransferase